MKKIESWMEATNLFSKMLLSQLKLKKWLENLDKIEGQVEFNQWELQSILKDFLIDELKEDLNERMKTREQRKHRRIKGKNDFQ